MYPDKVKLVFKNYPLDDDGPSMETALAANAAYMQGRFWEFHDRLFNEPDKLNDERIIEIAAEVGLDVEQFKEDLEDHRTLALVRRDILIGDEAGVDRVPTVFVNGTLVKNGSLERLETLIQRELANSAEKDPKSGS